MTIDNSTNYSPAADMPACDCSDIPIPSSPSFGDGAHRIVGEFFRLSAELDAAIRSGNELRVLSATAGMGALISALVERMNDSLTRTGFYDTDTNTTRGGYL